MGKKYICLDIGGTKVLGAVFDEKNSIVYKVKKKTRAEKGLEQIEEKIIKVVDELIGESGMDRSELAAIGAGAPGVINSDSGEIIYAPNLPWRNYNIRNAIETRFKVPFYIGNDANVGVLGEWKYGAGIDRKNIVGLFVGTGVGGGLILDGKLFTGSKHAAAELGHMVLNTEGPYCNCGQRGCLEAYAGKIGISREIKTQIERGRKTALKELMGDDINLLKSKALKKAIEEKDDLAIEVLDRAVYYLAAGAGSLINVFNPDMVILGGGVVEAMGDYIMPSFKKHIKRFAMPDILTGTELVKSALGDDAIVYGALAMITNKSGE
ncbi:MAG: ROK family protein [Clostridia bacterium]|nr:ROK family protein [Clostridia bacterium]